MIWLQVMIYSLHAEVVDAKIRNHIGWVWYEYEFWIPQRLSPILCKLIQDKLSGPESRSKIRERSLLRHCLVERHSGGYFHGNLSNYKGCGALRRSPAVRGRYYLSDAHQVFNP